MPAPRTLVLGRMPADATPETHLAAGPWCFVGREDLFPDWEDRYAFGPEPLATPQALETAVRQVRTLAAESVPDVAAALCPHADALPRAYWDMALGSWLIMAAQQIVERSLRLTALIAQWGHMPLRVPLLPEDCAFSFATEQDFVLYGALGHDYNHWLFSRLLEPIRPAAWDREYLPAVRAAYGDEKPADGSAGPRRALREAARRLLLRLPFPRIKGFSLRQSLAFSLALRRNRTVIDRSRPLTDYAGARPALPCPPLPLLLASLPQSLRRARHPARLTPASAPRTRVAHISAYEDTAYRLRLARWRGKGHKLVFIQHGGNYGHVRTDTMAPLTEYRQHAFITWGWTSQSSLQGNFLPLPHGQLARLRNAHKDDSGLLLYVGTEMPVFPYRMDCRPTPRQYVQYRDDKQWFFEALPRHIHRRCLYRPYFPVPGTLDDAPWLLPRFPDVRLCVGPLDPHMLSCRLLVLDHHGTTLELAMAANVPMVLFWDRAVWGVCPETEAALDELAAADIWHPTAESAAMHLRRIWDDVPAWWNSAPVQQARARWCARYALTVDGPIEPAWINTLETL